jgi:hypothetical protein
MSDSRYINPYRLFKGCIVPEWLCKLKDISPGAKLCYGRLKRYAGKKGIAYPRLKVLGKELAVGARQAASYIQELSEANLVEVESRKHARRSNKYRFLYHPVMGVLATKYSGERCAVKPPVRRVEVKEPALGSIGHADAKDTSHHHAKDTSHHHAKDVADRRESKKEESQRRKRVKEENQVSGSLRSPQSDIPPPLTPEKPISDFVTEQTGADSAASVVNLSEYRMAMDEANRLEQAAAAAKERVARLAQARKSVEAATDKNKAAVEVRTTRHDTKVWGVEHPTVQQKINWVNNSRNKIPREMDAAIQELGDTFREEFHQKFPEELTARTWERKDRTSAAVLILQYGGLAPVKAAVQYYIRNWDLHRPRFFKGTATLPTIGQLKALHTTLVPEAKLMSHALEVRARYHNWLATTGKAGKPPPADLQNEYNQVGANLKAIGL